MIEEKPLSSWAQFKEEVASIREKYGYHQVAILDDSDFAKAKITNTKVKNTVLFRGQSDASWPIQTTLERKTDSQPVNLQQYLRYVSRCTNEIESFTGRSWKIPDYSELQKEIQNKNEMYRVWLPVSEYLIYLRHHGFPSPLLDWSESPFIAAFFAFWEKPQTENVVILAYIDHVNGFWGIPGGAPTITVQCSNITTHQRHFTQKAWYTTATQWDENEKMHYFCSHEDVFKKADPTQNILIKIILSSSMRKGVLTELFDYNITPFTLFQTEDALIRTMELKQFDLDE